VPTVLVDGGNLGNEPSKQPVIVGAFVKMGYAACLTEAAKADSVRKEVGKATLAVVPPFDPTHADRTCWIGELDGVQVAFLRLEPPGQPDPGAWESALVSSLRALRKHADLMVLTSRLNDADNRRLAHRLGPTGLAQVMFVAPGNCTPDLPAEVDGVLLCPTKDRGQAVTLVVATRAARAPWKAWCRLEPVSSTYTPDRGVAGLTTRYYESRQIALVAGTAESPLSEAAYASAPRCKPCHAEAYEVWQKSAHARAVDTLRDKQRLVPECLTCHSEQIRRTGQFDGGLTAEDDGVQCSTCHGDAILHALTRGAEKMSRELTCAQCHSPEHAPGFDQARALTATRHEGR